MPNCNLRTTTAQTTNELSSSTQGELTFLIYFATLSLLAWQNKKCILTSYGTGESFRLLFLGAQKRFMNGLILLDFITFHLKNALNFLAQVLIQRFFFRELRQ